MGFCAAPVPLVPSKAAEVPIIGQDVAGAANAAGKILLPADVPASSLAAVLAAAAAISSWLSAAEPLAEPPAAATEALVSCVGELPPADCGLPLPWGAPPSACVLACLPAEDGELLLAAAGRAPVVTGDRRAGEANSPQEEARRGKLASGIGERGELWVDVGPQPELSAWAPSRADGGGGYMDAAAAAAAREAAAAAGLLPAAAVGFLPAAASGLPSAAWSRGLPTSSALLHNPNRTHGASPRC